MVSSSNYKKLLKDHAKIRIVKKTPQVLNEEDRGILVNVKIKRLQTQYLQVLL